MVWLQKKRESAGPLRVHEQIKKVKNVKSQGVGHQRASRAPGIVCPLPSRPVQTKLKKHHELISFKTAKVNFF